MDTLPSRQSIILWFALRRIDDHSPTLKVYLIYIGNETSPVSKLQYYHYNTKAQDIIFAIALKNMTKLGHEYSYMSNIRTLTFSL